MSVFSVFSARVCVCDCNEIENFVAHLNGLTSCWLLFWEMHDHMPASHPKHTVAHQRRMKCNCKYPKWKCSFECFLFPGLVMHSVCLVCSTLVCVHRQIHITIAIRCDSLYGEAIFRFGFETYMRKNQEKITQLHPRMCLFCTQNGKTWNNVRARAYRSNHVAISPYVATILLPISLDSLRSLMLSVYGVNEHA